MNESDCMKSTAMAGTTLAVAVEGPDIDCDLRPLCILKAMELLT
jgi:hypothetical protein